MIPYLPVLFVVLVRRRELCLVVVLTQGQVIPLIMERLLLAQVAEAAVPVVLVAVAPHVDTSYVYITYCNTW